ncbi:small subunit methyltransferase NEP1 [Seminavis robusta]|uniref:Small subunit methyltransferase NEP1 n=1 Tax=Seminavis robusta TaxID=568900 RepID=A0A9N8HKG6_9STRA|nr:small subunit methyltransferase NEP1 [Seminavis robusta]|eukprot:Sro756_g197710.1 small subunit methyltransferase NEP1 (276) ;mRNA; f:9585-10412
MAKKKKEVPPPSSSSESSSDSDGEEEPPAKKPRGSEAAVSSQLELAPALTPVKNTGKTKPIIVLLDQATVETIKNRRGVYELLNCDDHRDLCKKKLHKDPNIFRPDILHQELLALLDSPLNKAGMLKIYIQTSKNVLIDVNPAIRIPRTYKRFAGLMVQLLHKLKIKASSESTTLLKVIKNPFSQYLPPGTRCYGMSCEGTLYSPVAMAKALVPAVPDDSPAPTCFVVGAMSTGHVTIEDHPYIEKMMSVSEYPLSGAAALSRLTFGIEHHWGIV